MDYQASTPLCDIARDSMIACLNDEWANPHSTQHIAGLNSMLRIDEARSQLASFINADSNEIYFTSGATEANNLALQGLKSSDHSRKRILVSAIEHKAILEPAEHLSSIGFDFDIIPVDDQGIVQTDVFEQLMSDDVLLVSVMAANNEVGSIQPVRQISDIARSHGAVVHCDAAQAPLHMNVDVEALGVDLLSLSAHKMHGPKGVGLLYVSSAIREKMAPIILGGGQEDGLRSGTLPTALCVGFGSAAFFLDEHGEDVRNRARELRDDFWTRLRSTSNEMVLIGPPLSDRHSANLCVAFEGFDSDELLGVLQTSVCASSGSACSSQTIQASHVLRAMQLPASQVDGSVRFSFGMGLTEQDIEEAVEHITLALYTCRQYRA